MKLFRTLWNSWASLSLSIIVFFSSLLFPPTLFARDVEFTPGVSDVVKGFSGKYCLAISKGSAPQEAAEVASRQMISGLIFSGLLKEVMSVPKDDMAAFVATKIFDECGSDLSISQQDLNDYLVELAENGERQSNSQPQPFKPFGLG